VIDSGGQAHGLIIRCGGTGLDGTVVLAGANTYLGDTNLIIGRLQLDGGNNRLPVATRLFMGNAGDQSEFDLNGRSQQIAGLALRGGVTVPAKHVVTNSSATLATLTVNTAAGSPSTFGGALTGNLSLTKTGPDTLTLTGTLSHGGPTGVTGGTLALVGASIASPITVAPGASLGFTLGSPVTSTSSVELTHGTVKITGVVNGGSDYLLMTATGGITDAPALLTPIPDYKLEVRDGGTKLVLAHVPGGYASWAEENAGGQGPELDFDNDGVANGIEYFLNAAPGFTALPTLDASNTLTWTNGGNIPASAYGTQFVVQTSNNLKDWDNLPAVQLTTNTDGPGGSLTYILNGPAPRFVRLRVTPE
jgi:autotransporter-associated beta strand protein